MTICRKDVLSIFEQFSKIKVLVIGDVMFDHYIWGDVSRISPEAPVPVVRVTRESKMPGGSANVVGNLHSLGVSSGIIGLVGKDDHGRFIRDYFKKRNVNIRGLINSRKRPTVEKIRIIAHSQQVVRVDREKDFLFDRSEKSALIKKIKMLVPSFDAVILEDYGKGVLDQDVVNAVLSVKKRKKSLIISYDPKKGHELNVRNIDLGTPNFSEAESIVDKRESKMPPLSSDAIGKSLRAKWKSNSLFLTLGEKGMALFEKGKKVFTIPTVAREVYDVSGAGDTVIAVATAALAAGATPKEAALISNFAAGIVVAKLGTQTVSKKELLEKIQQHSGK